MDGSIYKHAYISGRPYNFVVGCGLLYLIGLSKHPKYVQLNSAKDSYRYGCNMFYPISQLFKSKRRVQQGLEIHGLEECGPWRYTVFNWFPKHLRYTVLG